MIKKIMNKSINHPPIDDLNHIDSKDIKWSTVHITLTFLSALVLLFEFLSSLI